MNLWGRDLLQQWNTPINIPPVSDMNYRQALDGRNNVVRHCRKQMPNIQTVQKQDANTKPTEQPRGLHL